MPLVTDPQVRRRRQRCSSGARQAALQQPALHRCCCPGVLAKRCWPGVRALCEPGPRAQPWHSLLQPALAHMSDAHACCRLTTAHPLILPAHTHLPFLAPHLPTRLPSRLTRPLPHSHTYPPTHPPGPQPLPPQDVVLRVTSSCICGSDLHFYQGSMPGRWEYSPPGKCDSSTEPVGLCGRTVMIERHHPYTAAPGQMAKNSCAACDMQGSRLATLWGTSSWALWRCVRSGALTRSGRSGRRACLWRRRWSN